MPNRIICESIKRSYQIDALSWFEEVVFAHLLVTVDDYGCHDGRINVLRNELFPTKDQVTTQDVEAAVEHLAEQDLILKYEYDGKPYIALTTWNRHQKMRRRKQKHPFPPFDALPEDCRQVFAECRQVTA